jgi:hypothetical protein
VPPSQSQLNSSMSMPSPLPQQVQAQGPPGFSYVDAPQTQTQSMVQQQQSTQQQQQQQRQLPSSLSDLVSTFEASKEKGLFGVGLLVSLWRLTSFLKSRATGSRTNKQGARCRIRKYASASGYGQVSDFRTLRFLAFIFLGPNITSREIRSPPSRTIPSNP